MRNSPVLLFVVAALSLSGCGKSTILSDAGPRSDTGPSGADIGLRDALPDAIAPLPDASSPPDGGFDSGCTPRTDRLDLLLVVDDSGSMTEEQVSFALELPRFLNALVTGVRPDGTTAEPVTDIHVGVVSTDMGIGGASVITCEDPDGDDGILQTATDMSGCPAMHPPFLAFRGGDTSEFVARASCASSLGTSGCGFEQPLEAMLKALTPSTSPVTFAEGAGHADGANAGFRRAGAALLVIVLTDEEDCSALDADVFNPDSSRYPGADLNLRCFHYPEAVHPVRRYVDGLLALEDHPSRVAFASIVGVPVDLAPAPGTPADFDAILSDARMQEYPDPEVRSRLTPSCNVPGRGLAFPPRRFVELSRDLDARGARTTLLSICQESFGLTDIAIAALAGTCE